MGSPCEIHLHDPSRDRADTVAAAAIDEVARLERKYSRYRPDSLASALNASAGGPRGVEVDDETAALLDYADTSHRESGGLFDPTSGVLRRAWDFRSGRLPSQEALDELLSRVGWQKVVWSRPRIALPLPGMEIDFGGFVKEYAADRAAALCRARGLGHGLVDLGGDLAVVGPHPDGAPWRVGIRDPRAPERAIATVGLARGAIATSGDYERFMMVDGVRYGHVLDPRTGWPVRGLASASVVADLCLVAGTASTVALLRGCDGSRWLDALGLPSLRVEATGALSGPLAAAARPRRPRPEPQAPRARA